MNWVFLDLIPFDYDVATPLARPLGGSQSALCYLAAALARRGHTVTALTGTSAPREILGVRCQSSDNIPLELLAAPGTILVVLNGPAEIGVRIRQAAPHHTRLILWTQHAHDQPAMLPLLEAHHVAAWDHIVCVSDWHRTMFHQRLGVPQAKLQVQRNALAPALENLFTSAEELAHAKRGPARLAYTSTPFRGLDVLLHCFPEIRRRHPGCELFVYSSMRVYGQPEAQDPHRHLYVLCRVTDGVQYRGSLPQPELARELAGVSVLAYPNTFAETSCIAVMEALAAGALVVTSELGALPETGMGFARLIAPLGGGRTRENFERDFVAAVDEELSALAADPAAFAQRRFEQVQAVHAACTWDVRAQEWEAAAAQWLAGRG